MDVWNVSASPNRPRHRHDHQLSLWSSRDAGVNSHRPQQHCNRRQDDSVMVCTKSVMPAAIDMIIAESAASIVDGWGEESIRYCCGTSIFLRSSMFADNTTSPQSYGSAFFFRFDRFFGFSTTQRGGGG